MARKRTRPLRPLRLLRCERGLAALEFALIAPPLLMLAFAIIIYALYFSVFLGVRQAASEGARAAVAGLSSAERESLATARAQEVMDGYGALLSGGRITEISAQPDGEGRFEVRVSYDLSGSPIMHYAGFVPLPSATIASSVLVTNGSY